MEVSRHLALLYVPWSVANILHINSCGFLATFHKEEFTWDGKRFMLFVSQQHSCAVLSGCLPLHDNGLGCTHRLGVLGQQVGRVRGLDPFPLPRYHPCCLIHTVSQVRRAEDGAELSAYTGKGSCLSKSAGGYTDSAHCFHASSSTDPSSCLYLSILPQPKDPPVPFVWGTPVPPALWPWSPQVKRFVP